MIVLVTGACGFVGLAIVEELLKSGATVDLLSLTPPPPEALARFAELPGRHRFHGCDVTDAAAVDAIIAATRPRQVVHGAALTVASSREQGRAADIVRVNVLGTVNVLEAAVKYKVERFVYLSSGAVYGAHAFAKSALDEEATTPMPESLYAVSKYAGERLSLRYHQSHGLNVVAPRLGTVFGPWEYRSGARDTLSAHYQATRLALSGEEAIIPRPGPSDWIYSRDVAAVIVALLDHSAPETAIVNVGSGSDGWTMADWCAKLAQVFPGFRYRMSTSHADATIDFHSPRDRAPLANRRLIEEIGFRPRYGLDAAFADYMDWVARNRSLILR